MRVYQVLLGDSESPNSSENDEGQLKSLQRQDEGLDEWLRADVLQFQGLTFDININKTKPREIWSGNDVNFDEYKNFLSFLENLHVQGRLGNRKNTG